MKRNYNKIFDLLVHHCGANESLRIDFISAHTSNTPCTEYRFSGALGWGGKYRSEINRATCYSEDETPHRIQMIHAFNNAVKRDDELETAAERLLVGISGISTPDCDFYEGLQADAEEELLEILLKPH